MAERVIFLLRDHAATQQLMEVADTWACGARSWMTALLTPLQPSWHAPLAR